MDLKQHLTGLSGPGSNKKAGYLCPYVVEELIDASGMVPVRVIPQNPDVDIADAYLPNNLCSYLRHAVDMALKQKLNVDIEVPEEPQMIGAIGAALIAMDEAKKNQ